MHRTTPHPRGMALVMAMIVVVLITLLVAGAISFTGTERAASEVQAQQDSMSACVQAARNLFLSKLDMSMLPTPDSTGVMGLPISFEETLPRTDPTTGKIDTDPMSRVDLRTGHLGQVQSYSAKLVSGLEDTKASVNDLSNVLGSPGVPHFYTVSAVCRETADISSPEREVEFMVRVGF